MSDGITGIVRIVHIVSAIAWVGGALLFGNIIGPRVLQRGPPTLRKPFLEAVLAAMTRYYMIVGPLAILSGLVLVGQLWGWGSYADAFQAPGGYGLWLGIGAISAIVMAIVGFGVIAPTGKKLLAAMSKMTGPPTDAQQAELGAMGKKIGISSMLVMVFGTLTAISMALAVNVVR